MFRDRAFHFIANMRNRIFPVTISVKYGSRQAIVAICYLFLESGAVTRQLSLRLSQKFQKVTIAIARILAM